MSMDNRIPILLTNEQTEKIRVGIQQEMETRLGYSIIVGWNGDCKVGEDITYRLYNLLDKDFNDETQTYFNCVVSQQIAKIAGLGYDSNDLRTSRGGPSSN